jgi:uncharacterized protein Usg
MKFIRKKTDLVFYQENFLTIEECNYYIKKSPKLGAGKFLWSQRTVNITNEPIVKKVIDFFKQKLNFTLECIEATTQNWNVNSSSDLHIHNERGREKTKYNSLIYLNDNYNGGEFYTKNGIVIKPSVGLLTLFNGQKVWHGVNMVKKNDRHTLIFWWKNNG